MQLQWVDLIKLQSAGQESVDKMTLMKELMFYLKVVYYSF